MDLALLENHVQANQQVHDPLSDRLNRLMAQNVQNFQRFSSRTEVCGQWAALTVEDHELMLSDVLAYANRVHPGCDSLDERGNRYNPLDYPLDSGSMGL